MRRTGVVLFLIALAFFGGSEPAEADTGIPGAVGRVEYWFPLGAAPQRRATFVVTHDSWGPVGSGRNTARSQAGAKVGAEWWVLADGTILHSDRERITGHCGGSAAPAVGNGCNARAVGIEFEGYGNVTEAQVRSGMALIRFLQERYCIQPTNIAGHRKAPREGIIMEQAGKNMNHRPECTGIPPRDALPEDVVASANAASQAYRPSLQDIQRSYGSSASSYQPGYPGYAPGASFDTVGVMGSFGFSSPEQLTTYFDYTVPEEPNDILKRLLDIAQLPNHLESEADADSEKSAEDLVAPKDTDKVYIFDPTSSTTEETELGEVSQYDGVTIAGSVSGGAGAGGSAAPHAASTFVDSEGEESGNGTSAGKNGMANSGADPAGGAVGGARQARGGGGIGLQLFGDNGEGSRGISWPWIGGAVVVIGFAGFAFMRMRG